MNSTFHHECSALDKIILRIMVIFLIIRAWTYLYLKQTRE